MFALLGLCFRLDCKCVVLAIVLPSHRSVTVNVYVYMYIYKIRMGMHVCGHTSEECVAPVECEKKQGEKEIQGK